MKQYNSLKVKLSNSQINKSKPEIKNETEVVLRLSPNMISYNRPNFPHKLLLTNRQVANHQLTIRQVANHQLISNYQHLKYLRWYNQEDFLVDYFAHY